MPLQPSSLPPKQPSQVPGAMLRAGHLVFNPAGAQLWLTRRIVASVTP